jgi:hypothetical protein
LIALDTFVLLEQLFIVWPAWISCDSCAENH